MHIAKLGCTPPSDGDPEAHGNRDIDCKLGATQNSPRYKSKAEIHQIWLLQRHQSSPYGAIRSCRSAYNPSTSLPTSRLQSPQPDVCCVCGEEFPNQPYPNWDVRLNHLINIHKFAPGELVCSLRQELENCDQKSPEEASEDDFEHNGNGNARDPRLGQMSLGCILSNKDDRSVPSIWPPSPTPSAMSVGTKIPRDPRQRYQDEEGLFIWYHRIDLHESWDVVEEEFQHQFHQQRKKAGLQCKFYRLLDQRHIDKVRVQAKHRLRHENPEGYQGFGLIRRTKERPLWIRKHHLPQHLKSHHTCLSLRCESCLNRAKL